MYAHSGGMLYRLNNLTLAAIPVGPMTGLSTDLLDLAIDANDGLVGVTATKLFSLNATTGAATFIRDLTGDARGLTSLSYVPQSLTDPASPDILVSANGSGQVFQINQATGTATQIGSYGTAAGNAVIGSSGDLFGVRGLGIFATVDVGNDASANDYLARIDPANGWKATPLGIGTGFNKIFGLGYWGGKIYGFVDNGFEAGGKMIEIDPNTGAGTVLSSADVRWFGAGVATDAPLL
ncbi:MAG: hypothetical protein H0T89_33720 [Deltaproteobacteria bacterium]|nr:hypothetical protein [Deltaproteobacteria bacterium]MDQ3296424.1 hypothetical protein [Myxococcota bacterium]